MRAIQNDRLDILKRYQVSSGEALDDTIAKRQTPSESPAWEDRIAIDNLQEALSNVDSALASLLRAEENRDQRIGGVARSGSVYHDSFRRSRETAVLAYKMVIVYD